MNSAIKLTDKEKGYIRAHCSSRPASIIATEINRCYRTVCRFITKNGLKNSEINGRPRKPLSQLKTRIVEYELYVEGVLLDTLRNYDDHSELKMITKMREKNALVIFGKEFHIYKRVPCFFPHYKIPNVYLNSNKH